MNRQWRDLKPEVPRADRVPLPWNNSTSGPHISQPLSLYSEESALGKKMHNSYPKPNGYNGSPPYIQQQALHPDYKYKSAHAPNFLTGPYQKPLIIFVAVLGLSALIIGLSVKLTDTNPKYIEKSYKGVLEITETGNFKYDNVRNNATYKDWFCGQIRSALVPLHMKDCNIEKISKGSVVTEYNLTVESNSEDAIGSLDKTLSKDNLSLKDSNGEKLVVEDSKIAETKGEVETTTVLPTVDTGSTQQMTTTNDTLTTTATNITAATNTTI